MSRSARLGGIARRDLLRAGFGSLVLGASDKLWRSPFWEQAAAAQPDRGELYGWLGRAADAMDPEGHANYIVNVDTQQSLAVRSRGHVPLVFDDPQKFVRTGFADQTAALKMIAGHGRGTNEAQEFMFG